MTIELVGLPGTGKSTFAKQLASACGGRVVTISSRTVLLTYGFLGILARPRSSLSLLGLLLREKDAKLRRSLILNVLLGASAKYASSSRADIIDQGYAQSVIAALPDSADTVEIAHILAGIPKDTLLVWCEIPGPARKERISSRVRVTREEFGATAVARFHEKSEGVYTLVKKTAETVIPSERMLTLDPSDPQAVNVIKKAIEAMEKNGKRRFSIHFAGKLSMLSIAYLMSRIVRIFRAPPEVVVLMYHSVDSSGWKLSVTPEGFELQMAYLARRDFVVPLSHIVSYAKGERPIRRHAVAVTFDDGYRDLLTTVLPILERYNIPATVFVPSDLSVRTDPDGRPRLTLEELRTLASSTLITIGSHAQTHRKFTELLSEEINDESLASANELERMSGKRPSLFSYPFGARSAGAERAVKEAGYEAAFGITEGTIHQGDNLFRLKRVQVDSTMNFLLFRLRLTSAVDWNRRIVDVFRASL